MIKTPDNESLLSPFQLLNPALGTGGAFTVEAGSCRIKEKKDAFTVCEEGKKSLVLIAVLQNHLRRRGLSGIFLTLT